MDVQTNIERGGSSQKLERAKVWLSDQIQNSPNLMIKLFRNGEENKGEGQIVEMGYGKYLGINTQGGTLQVRKFVPEDKGYGFRDTGETIEFNLSNISQISTRSGSSIRF